MSSAISGPHIVAFLTCPFSSGAFAPTAVSSAQLILGASLASVLSATYTLTATPPPAPLLAVSIGDALDPKPPTPTTPGLSIRTNNLHISTLSKPPPTTRPEQPLPPLPPGNLDFGSRFLLHSTVPIRCLLPLQANRLLLIGHNEGLSVLDMYPQDWNDTGGIALKGPEDAAVRTIWEGKCAFQMSILELDNASGVVLMLVDPELESPLTKDSEFQRTVRMYNLGSLVSLAKWAVANKDAHPLNLGAFAPQQTPTDKHRPTSSIVVRGFKSLVSGSGSNSPTETSPSYMLLLTPQSSIAVSSAFWSTGATPSRRALKSSMGSRRFEYYKPCMHLELPDESRS
ncbi:hypothetical protein K438DRAFT_1986333 [Mycena galopus ATCC 62051]|nr:hypothetical protein K438DRAFT_1986333 [Mycena galopus ATCC 62051]